MKRTLTFIVLSKEEENSKELSRALGSFGGASLLMLSDNAEQVFTEALRLRPSAVIIALPASSEPMLKLVHRISVECPTTAVICASREASPDLILHSLRAGARDFLRLPAREDEFETVFARVAEFATDNVSTEPKKRGKALAVFSSKGGCGCSFIATNLAVARNAPTVLLDLNLQSGELDMFLGLRPKFSFADVVENRERLDDSLLTNYLTPHSKNLSLLAAPLETETAEDIEPRHVFEVIELLRERFEHVVIDTPHSFDPVTIAALDHADEILVVLTLEINAIRSTRRALEVFDRLGYPRSKIRLVVNRWSKHIELNQQQVERFLGERVVGFIQSDYKAAVNSINLGQPLVESAPSAKVSMDIKRIADSLFGGGGTSPLPAPASPRKPALNSIFRRRTETADDFGLRVALDKATLDEA